MIDLFKLTRPVLHAMDAETAHGLTIKAMKTGLVPSCAAVRHDALSTTVCGLTFPNPIGLAAGFDKNAEVIDASFKMGFGFVEVGTVTPKPQDGNPKPRVFRDASHGAVINRMGFPNGGADVFESNFNAQKKRGIVGINVGMNKDQTNPASDYTALIQRFGGAADYITINISSPNTPGLRDLQRREPLTELLNAIKAVSGDTPVFLKLAPDLTKEQCEELAQTVMDCGVDGLILTNTTLDRPDHLSEAFRNEKGGLSGAPLTVKSTSMIAAFYKLTEGKLPIIGAGGVSSGADAYAKITAGASLIQLYSALVFHGPALVNRINRELITLLEHNGFASIKDAVGSAHG